MACERDHGGTGVALMLVMWLSDTSRWCITEPCPEIVVHLEGERDCTAIPGAKLGPVCLCLTCLSLHCCLFRVLSNSVVGGVERGRGRLSKKLVRVWNCA